MKVVARRIGFVSINIRFNSSISAPLLVWPNGPGFSCCFLNVSSIDEKIWNFQPFCQIPWTQVRYSSRINFNMQRQRFHRWIDLLHMILQKPKVVCKDLKLERLSGDIRLDSTIVSRLWRRGVYLPLNNETERHTFDCRFWHSLNLNRFIVCNNSKC